MLRPTPVAQIHNQVSPLNNDPSLQQSFLADASFSSSSPGLSLPPTPLLTSDEIVGVYGDGAAAAAAAATLLSLIQGEMSIRWVMIGYLQIGGLHRR